LALFAAGVGGVGHRLVQLLLPVRDLWVCSPRFGKEKGLQKMKRKRKETHQGRAA
jgi:hypothetical protein